VLRPQIFFDSFSVKIHSKYNKMKILNTIIHGDCRNVFPKIINAVPINLIAFDPPYNIGFSKYQQHADTMEDDEYIDMIKVFKGDIPTAICQYPEEMMKYISPALGVPNEVLVWCYNSNIGKQSRLINIYNKMPDKSKIKFPYQNPGDTRIRKLIAAGKTGRSMYDWFDDIQIVKNVSKLDYRDKHPCPVPVDLMKRIIILLTEEGDTVLDPFSGSGTTAIACLETNRNYIGIEIDPEYISMSLKRIESWKIKQHPKTIDLF